VPRQSRAQRLPRQPRQPRAQRLHRRRQRAAAGLVAASVLVVGGLSFAVTRSGDGAGSRATAAGPTRDSSGTAASSASGAGTTTSTTTSTTPRRPAPDVLADPGSSFGRPYGRTVRGLLTFRGNPTRSFHGVGPVPRRPAVQWRFPERSMCSPSSEKGQTRVWCGMGWTGQPAVFERGGRTWLVFGAYDRAVHFVDAHTGARILPDFPTGDIIKGSVTVDPGGYPLVYVGSRDNYLRVLAIDRPEPVELWRLSADAVSPTMWNNDWDGSPLVLRDHLVEGGENSQFHVVRLNRAFGADGLVTVAPQLVFHAPGWDDQLLDDVGGSEVSIENSVAIAGDVAYFGNSGGLVQGWDLSSLRTARGTPTRVFRYWVGDDTDASIVVDRDGALYVGVEHERANARSHEVGQLVKLDPRRPENPLVWSVHDEGTRESGTWSTPAIVGNTVIWPTRPGRVFGLDRATGKVRWEKRLPAPLMGSPVVVDGVWLQGDCAGVLHAFDVRRPAHDPPELWSVELGGCIESTPAVWKGRIYVGTRGGFLHAIGDT
jgi:outer membrane protein assembly factor BamB